MSATLTISIIALTLSFVLCVCITVLVSKALSNAFRTVESMHDRMQAANDKTLDRLMTIRWEDYVSVQTLQDEQEGGFFAPEEQKEEEVTVTEPTRWGALSDLNARLEAIDNERGILDEDFPDERKAS